MPIKKHIYLQKIGSLDDKILIELKKNLESVFKDYINSVKILSDEFPLINSEYNSSERKYNAKLVLNRLENIGKNKSYFRVLGVMEEDIYSGTYLRVFGIARSSVALISITRLLEKFYSKAKKKDVEELRILKEAVHELGHTFGLKHCNNHCVMKFSSWPSNIKQKPSNYCEPCIDTLNKFFLNSD